MIIKRKINFPVISCSIILFLVHYVPEGSGQISFEENFETSTVVETTELDLASPNLHKNDSTTIDPLSSRSSMQNISQTIRALFQNYDKLIRPDFHGPAIPVDVSMHIKSFASVNEVEMEFKVDFYLRQSWRDSRLIYNLNGVKALELPSEVLNKLWTPDTFFLNEKTSYVHKALVSNQFVRILPNGEIHTSTRLSLTASCPMNLYLYPMDYQVCSIDLASYGYTNDKIEYHWKNGSQSVHVDVNSATLPQFMVQGYHRTEMTSQTITGNYSALSLKFLLVRSINHYMTQVYIPSFLVVVISYFPLWIGRDSIAPRLGLGVTSVLTQTTIYMANNAKSPPINYVKALDVYLAICFVGVFSTLLETAIVGYLMKKLKTMQEKRKKEEEIKKKDLEANENCEAKNGKGHKILGLDPEATQNEESAGKKKGLAFWVPKFDVFCRIVFPILFATFNAVYWAHYLGVSQLNFADDYWTKTS